MTAAIKKSIRRPARIEHLEEIVDFVLATLRENGIAERITSDLHLAVDEACTNCCSYAYPAGRGGDVELTVRISPEEVAVIIRDWGEPFNPLKAAAPDLSLDLDDRPIGGLGIFLLKKFSDRVEYRREEGANVLTIVKKIGNGE